ncbi:putative reverse transcriptase zinc-binding domain-containing protein [Helianthus annuus]|nr:putative reverse transcriptase zinc-binding domain-containing protein [Helianthus annuus]
MDIYPVLINMQPPNLNTNRLDTISWIDNEGKEVQYSSKAVWNTIRVRGPRVEWHNVVWFSQCIPCHAFLLWLVIGNKLKTQDKLKHWEVGGLINLRLMCCSLCQNGNDSHAHLFFECVFAAQIWSKVKAIGDMQHLTDNWENVLDHLVSKAKSKSAKSVIGRLLAAATVYHIWQERNCRLFSDRKRSVTQVADAIVASVRLKLITMRFKNTRQVDQILRDWKLPKRLVIYDGIG